MNRVQKYMKLRILLATAALLSTTCSACTFYANALKPTQTHALASVAVGYAEVGRTIPGILTTRLVAVLAAALLLLQQGFRR